MASSYGGRNRLCASEFVTRLDRLTTAAITPVEAVVEEDESGVSAGVNGTVKVSSVASESMSNSVDKQVEGGDSSSSSDSDNSTDSSSVVKEEACKLLWREIEAELLGGQSMQGVSTCQEVYEYLLSLPDDIWEGFFSHTASHGPSTTTDAAILSIPQANDSDSRSEKSKSKSKGIGKSKKGVSPPSSSSASSKRIKMRIQRHIRSKQTHPSSSLSSSLSSSPPLPPSTVPDLSPLKNLSPPSEPTTPSPPTPPLKVEHKPTHKMRADRKEQIRQMFPLMSAIYHISHKGHSAGSLFDWDTD